MPNLSERDELKIDILAEEGNVLLEDTGDWSGALDKWKQALTLVPDPKVAHAQSMWLYASIGEAYACGNKPYDAKDAFETAYRCPDGHINPYILLQLGKLNADLENEDLATKFLLRAYMIEGASMFEDEMTYLDYLSKRVDLKSAL
ncbi:hypothetical protein K3729_18105 (plasmid) [Rhodobacteraceae bacterium S2214]|nr:hypothetical protein K3729_18105 [Rhodobacteraceae bacterium S2214]